MTTLVVPPLDEHPWPTLGPQVCQFIEQNLVHGPGDLRGQPARIDDEKRALIYRAYEVFPKDHPNAGRRRFRRVAWSLRKGSAKTELAAWIAACELHPEAPVRCDGWRWRGRTWVPVGVGVRDPYIPLVAYTQEQTEDLAYAALYVILSEGPLRGDFDIGLTRIMRIHGDGKAVALASAPDSRDGARTTFEHFDETHRFTLPSLKEAHATMLLNLPKRKIADPWALETTTAYLPGEGSVAEHTMDYAREVLRGEVADSRLFFFHRQASEKWNLDDPEQLRAAELEASGPVAEWSDIDGILEQFRDPTLDRSYLARMWLNQIVQATDHAFDVEMWKELVKPGHVVPKGAWITLGFDGARTLDTTALVATEVATGYQWLAGMWSRPAGWEGPWEVDRDLVDARVDQLFADYRVWRMNADPPYWEVDVRTWAGRYGQEVVIEFFTASWRRIGVAIRAFRNAIENGELSHEDNPTLQDHIGNCFRRPIPAIDEDGEHLWTIQKERALSVHKIDAAMAAVLSWEARTQALRAGVRDTKVQSIFFV